MNRLNLDLLSEINIYFDPVVNRFRYKGGVAGKPIRGTFVSREEVLKLEQAYLITQKEKLIALSQRVKNREVGIGKELSETIKKIHITEASIKAGGIDRLTNSDLGSIGNILKFQYGVARDSTASRIYGIKYLLKDIENNPDYSEARIRQRLEMYTKAGEISGNLVRHNQHVKSGYRLARRLDAKDNQECSDCIRYASLGWVGIDTLPIPKTKCKCLTNCRCKIEYKRIED